MAEEIRLPAEFEARMKKMLGEDWESFLAGYTRGNYRALRFNRRKRGMPASGQRATTMPESPAAAGNEPADAASQEELLRRAGVSTLRQVPWAEDAWYYEEEARPGRHLYHEMGLYYIQEPSAMSAASLLFPEPGERILDLCAAPGGKSTQIASLLGPEGLLIANEIVPNRSRILSQNIERMGIDNCIVTNEDGKDLRRSFPEYFHRILVDAPCSGEGMFRKNEEALGEWSPENVAMCADRQQEILGYAAEMLMPGGTLVYSTCTFAPAENEDGIRRFLEDHPEFTVLHRDCPWFAPGVPSWARGDERVAGTFRLWPHLLQGEGHYAAVLRKAGEYTVSPEELRAAGYGAAGISGTGSGLDGRDPGSMNAFGAGFDAGGGSGEGRFEDGRKGRSKKNRRDPRGRKDREGSRRESHSPGALDRDMMARLRELLEGAVTEETMDWILSGSLRLFGDNLYRLPQGAPDLSGIRVQRPGLHIGTFRKNRFEPSHALALRIGRDQARRVLDLGLEDPRAAAYFHGETLQGDCVDPALPGDGAGASEPEGADGGRGWCLVCVDGFSAGWGKADRGMVKNHYPKGLRR